MGVDMIHQSIPKWLRLLFACTIPSLVSVLVLVFTLVQSGYWNDAVNALVGKYTTLGLPSNPWLDFLPFFLPTVFLSVLFSWLASTAARGTSPITVKLPLSILLSLAASVTFGFAIVLASTSYLWFQGFSVIGVRGSPVLFWLPFCLLLIVLIRSCYKSLL